MSAAHTPPLLVMRPGGIVPVDTESTAALIAEVRRLHTLNAELLDALTDVIGWVPGAHWHTTAPMQSVERARAVIRKAWEAA